MKNSIKIFVLISVLTLLSSCVKENVYHKIDSAGQSQIKVDIDISGLAAISKSFATGSTSTSSTGTDVCSDSQVKNTGNITDSKCESTGPNKASISGNVDMLKYGYLTSSGDTLIHDLKSIEKIMSKKGEEAPKPKTSSEVANQPDPKSLGMEVTYTVEYPGDIISSDIGEVTGNKVKIDVFELNKMDKAIVISSLPAGSAISSYTGSVLPKKAKNIRFKILNLRQRSQVAKLVNSLSSDKNNELKARVENIIQSLSAKADKSPAENKRLYMLQDILILVNQKAGN